MLPSGGTARFDRLKLELICCAQSAAELQKYAKIFSASPVQWHRLLRMYLEFADLWLLPDADLSLLASPGSLGAAAADGCSLCLPGTYSTSSGWL